MWLIAVVLVIYGIYVLIAQRNVLLGIVLIVLGLIIGPGGVSIFNP
ncbi:GPGG-motif small membrane protein [Actinocorallia sp. API 0066]|nr:GPGG-motif small membrane protein [Actinocorallia sp. API 0066]MCD0448110.1 GPGG-motif small membrane protein [Actinocorallia sp. API 0066]